MTLNFHIWSMIATFHNFENIVEHICDNIKDNKHISTLNIFLAEEMYFPEAQELHQLCIEKNIRLNYLFGGGDIEYWKKLGHFSPKENRSVYIWSSFFISRTYYFLRKLNTVEVENDYQYPLICMNSRASWHRCQLMDLLAKNDLINDNAITWHHIKPFRDIDAGHVWKYWTPTRLELTEHIMNSQKHRHDTNHQFNQFSVPLKYHRSFLQLISETAINSPFITEKTAIPMFHKKLFITAGSKDFYKMLTQLGFKLYDEVIDYSFDSMDSYEVRLENIIYQVKQLTSDRSKFKEIYKMLDDKLEHNKQLAIKYGSATGLPSIVKWNNVPYYDYLLDRL